MPRYPQNLKVYLAGGFKSGWQDTVMREVPHVGYLDPRCHKLLTPKSYTEWDLAAIKKSDLVFAYLEDTNPGGYALALELGYAKALSKKIIFVDSTSNKRLRKQYLTMLYSIASLSCPTLVGGIRHLARLAKGL